MGLISKRGEYDGEQLADLSISGLEHLGDGDESVFELDEWPLRLLAVLKERLQLLAVPHEWKDDTTLVVSVDDEAWVERIMDQVEEEQSLTLDPDVPHVAYDLTGWDDTARSDLLTALEDEAIPHGMDGEELFVHEIDEDRVDEIIDAIVDPESAASAEETASSADVMGDLFLAGDRLGHDPTDHEGVGLLVDALRAAGSAPAPYGMDKVWWEGVLDRARALAGLLGADEPDLDAVSAAAEELRDGLRPYV